MTFPTSCGACGAQCECRMFVTSILFGVGLSQFLSSVVVRH